MNPLQALGPEPASCSAQTAAAGEELGASASVAPSWLLVEQPGPWGRQGATQSDLPTEVAAALQAACDAHGIRLTVIRRSAQRRELAVRSAFLVSARPQDPWIRRQPFAAPEDLLGLGGDLSALGRGERPGAGEPWSDPLVLVCTHGRRDACCARLGRPVFKALAVRHPEETWQSSHLGGHRFAPSIVTLPDGAAFGGVDVPAACRVVQDAWAGSLDLRAFRGRCAHTAWQQAADVLVRRELGLTAADAVSPRAVLQQDDDGAAVQVLLADGRLLRADIRRRPTGELRPVSCGEPPTPTAALALVALNAIAR